MVNIDLTVPVPAPIPKPTNESPISDEFSQKDKIAPKPQPTLQPRQSQSQQAVLVNSQEQPKDKQAGTKLLSYVETYRSMIEKINNYDKIIQRSGSSGKTLDLSGGGNLRKKRTYTMRNPGSKVKSPGNPKPI